MADINNMINSIPDTAGDFSIISKERKQLYQKEMEFRLEKLLLPEYSKIISMEQIKDLKKNNNKSDDYYREY